MEEAVILAVVVTGGLILIYPPLARAPLWRATITPLASIIGSGFLVLGPILNASYGLWAPAAMAALCLVAYAFGHAIRFNIRLIGDLADRGTQQGDHALEEVSSWALAVAYVVSVAYYLNLFGAFAVSLTGFDDPLYGRMITTAVYVMIAAVGWSHGFAAFERMEQVSVGLKLAIIGGLLTGLVFYFFQQAEAGALKFDPPQVTGWPAIALAFGLIVTVQGFETSRYLGATYDARTRIRSMRLAQLISTVIYMSYVLLLGYVFAAPTGVVSETAIIDMMQIVTPILPGLLLVAALSAQFSAAVADTSGAGGLVAELTGGRISVRMSYGVIVGAGLFLTWRADVFTIISVASRGFALYYGLQALIAAHRAYRTHRPLTQVAGYGALALLGGAILLFGAAVE